MSKECFDEIVKKQMLGSKAFIDLKGVTALAKEISEDLKERNRVLKQMWGYGGRVQWKKESGYGKRILAQTAMFMWKQAFGPKLLSRKFRNQKAEAGIKVRIFNKLTSLEMPQAQAWPI